MKDKIETDMHITEKEHFTPKDQQIKMPQPQNKLAYIHKIEGWPLWLVHGKGK